MLQTEHEQGHAVDDKRAWVASSLSSAVLTPPSFKSNEDNSTNQPVRKKLSFRKQAKVHGLSPATGWRYLSRALKKRKLMELNSKDIFWSYLPPRLKAQKVPDTVRRELQEWIMKHPCLIVSPVKDDTLLVKDKDGKKVRMPKLLLECSVRELHNNMLMPVDKGGFAGAYNVHGIVQISDTALRSFLPKNLRKMTNRYKQMCCCETCVVPKGLLTSLHSWQTKRIALLRKNGKNDEATKYSEEILDESGKFKIDTYRDALRTVMCPWDKELGLPKWKCVLRRCDQCPTFPIPSEESGTSSDAPHISFHIYKQFYKCSIHKVLPDGEKHCTKCRYIYNGKNKRYCSMHGALPENELDCMECELYFQDHPNYRKGTIRTRKEQTLLTRPIGIFHRDFFVPMLKKLAFHFPHVIMLGKNYCGRMRKEAFEKALFDIMERRDYAERLAGLFDMELQQSHFGTTCSLSMEGCSVEYMNKGEINMEFHTHFADKSDQNAASTHAHMEVLLDDLFKRGKLFKRKSILWEFTDGCKKQYRCNVVVYLLSYLASAYAITINRQIDAPGHGKGVVDGINAIDKNYLSKMMNLIMTPEVITSKDRMSSATMIEGAEKSFAKECLRLCSNPNRKTGVKSEKKSAKREANAKLKERFYHLQEYDEVKYNNKQVALEGFKNGPREGISSMYNIRADPDLGFGKAAIRRIPCACNSCVAQLSIPWVPGKSATEQDRYKVNKHCKYWSIFEGTNDWNIITCKEVMSGPDSDSEDLKRLF